MFLLQCGPCPRNEGSASPPRLAVQHTMLDAKDCAAVSARLIVSQPVGPPGSRAPARAPPRLCQDVTRATTLATATRIFASSPPAFRPGEGLSTETIIFQFVQWHAYAGNNGSIRWSATRVRQFSWSRSAEWRTNGRRHVRPPPRGVAGQVRRPVYASRTGTRAWSSRSTIYRTSSRRLARWDGRKFLGPSSTIPVRFFLVYN
jgi:hypothetical protein